METGIALSEGLWPSVWELQATNIERDLKHKFWN